MSNVIRLGGDVEVAEEAARKRSPWNPSSGDRTACGHSPAPGPSDRAPKAIIDQTARGSRRSGKVSGLRHRAVSCDDFDPTEIPAMHRLIFMLHLAGPRSAGALTLRAPAVSDDEIARAFLVTPQRWRSDGPRESKIREAGITRDAPPGEPARVER